MKIIVVDDEIAALNTFLAHIVDDLRAEYKMFMNDPVSALEFIDKNHVDAAFLDINMPKINGVDLAEKLIQKNANVKIVFISGYAQDENEIARRLGANLKGFCYKPYDADLLFRYIDEIKEELGNRRDIFIKTFGSFDLFVDDKPVKFSSFKSKELLALLVDKQGAHLSMGEAISYLWPDKNLEHGKRLYRDAVCRLRILLKDNGLSGLISFYRAVIVINKNNVRCDYWDFLAQEGGGAFTGTYMPSYDWSIETQSRLDIIKK